jgi:hypothetical protein
MLHEECYEIAGAIVSAILRDTTICRIWKTPVFGNAIRRSNPAGDVPNTDRPEPAGARERGNTGEKSASSFTKKVSSLPLEPQARVMENGRFP